MTDNKKCKAKSKQSQQRCKNWAMPGKEVCYIHGGKTPGGIASPNFKHGRYSKYMPTRLLDKYKESTEDPELLNLTAEIGLIETRLADVLKRVDMGESGALWERMSTEIADVNELLKVGSVDLVAAKLTQINEVVENGIEDWHSWREVRGLIEQRRKLVESERKRLVEMEQIITAEQAMALYTAIAQAVVKHVSDRDILSKIQNEFMGIINRPAIPSTASGLSRKVA